MSESARRDKNLVRRCLANDQDACAELVNLYARMVGTIIWRAVKQDTYIDDLIQETFMRVFRGLPYFDARAKLSTWICTIAHRVAIDHARSAARASEQQIDRQRDEGMTAAAATVSGAADPETAAAQRELEALLNSEIDRLPDKYRLPILYVTIQGLDYETVSEMLDQPLGTVKANVFYAKRMLKERLIERLRTLNTR